MNYLVCGVSVSKIFFFLFFFDRLLKPYRCYIKKINNISANSWYFVNREFVIKSWNFLFRTGIYVAKGLWMYQNADEWNIRQDRELWVYDSIVDFLSDMRILQQYRLILALRRLEISVIITAARVTDDSWLYDLSRRTSSEIGAISMEIRCTLVCTSMDRIGKV